MLQIGQITYLFCPLNRIRQFQDTLLAELMNTKKHLIYTFHEHDSLLENQIDQELSEEERKAAVGRIWEREEGNQSNEAELHGYVVY